MEIRTTITYQTLTAISLSPTDSTRGNAHIKQTTHTIELSMESKSIIESTFTYGKGNIKS